MNLSILRKFMPTKASLAGAGEALVDFSEREAKRGKTMATQQFIAAFQRAQSSGDKGEVDRVLSDPSFLDADPVVRMRAMTGHQQQAQRDASRELDLRGLEQDAEQHLADTRLRADELKAEGFNVEINNEDSGLPSGRPSFGTPRAGIRILGKGPNLQALEKANVQSEIAAAKIKEHQADKLDFDVQELLARSDDDARWLRTIAKDPGALEYLRPETKERLAPHLVEMGVSLTKPKRMPVAFQKMLAEYNSALMEVGALEATIKKFGGTHPVTGYLSLIPGTDEQKALASIDRARQRIGKTLEGGVLRKEDEEKYKKILPTITDHKVIAEYKLKELRQALMRDKQALMQVWETYGAGDATDPELQELLLEQAERIGLRITEVNSR